jgi:predicted RNase H-like nuclease (RuvC/YqgF family)
MVLNKIRKTFFAGQKASDLEQVINSLQKNMASSQVRQQFLEQELESLRHHTSFSIQKLGLVRFNPFNDGEGISVLP